MRCYNGCPDSELQSFLDNRQKLLSLVRERHPEAHVTYHHGLDGGYVVHVWGRSLSGTHSTYEAACHEVLRQ